MSHKKLSSFAKFTRKYRLSVKEAARVFEVTERTVRNWKYKEPPRWVRRAMERQDRWLSGIHPDWAGFRIGWNGKLYGPYGFQVSAEYLRHEAVSKDIHRYVEKHLGKPKMPE